MNKDTDILAMPKKKLLIISHAPSENTQRLLEAVIKGAKHPDIANIDVKCITPVDTRAEDIKAAQAIIIGTTENLGYMAGLIKDVFDRCYYDCLEHTQGLPFTFYVRAGHDGTGTRKAIETITTGLRWRLVQEPLICKGDFNEAFIAQCEELGLTMAASLDAGII
jgi:multimeric flavodoxin WrbA